ncbi:MAG: serine hydrolase domain-containing protein [Agriterribacter sp.]
MRLLILSILLFSNVPSKGQDQLKQVDHLLDSIFPKDKPGIAVAIVQDDKTIFSKGYGLSNIITKSKITATTNFNIASLTKQFTAAGMLYLQEKKLLNPEQTIDHYFPDMNKNVSEKVTLTQLLTHSSGIIDHYDFVQVEKGKHGYARQVYDAIKYKDSFYFAPGSSFRYSNTAYCLSGLILEKVSGKNYKDFIQQTFFSPLAMNHSTVWNEQEKIYNAATGYNKDSATGKFIKSQAEENVFFSTEGDGAIYTSVNDYVKWFQSLQHAAILNREDIALARSIQNPIPNQGNLGYGYGWFINTRQQPTYVYHSGGNGGFRTYSFSIPGINYLVVIFANRSDINIEQVVMQINQILLPNLPPLVPIEVLTS